MRKWFLLFIFIMMLTIIIHIFRVMDDYNNPKMMVYSSEKYYLKIMIGGTNLVDENIRENLFYHLNPLPQKGKIQKGETVLYKIGCGKLEKVNINENKGLLYGKLSYVFREHRYRR